MKLKELGKNSSSIEVTQISAHGIWLLAKGIEYFLPFENFSWFENATVAQIHHIQLLHGFHLRWPDLDVDLELLTFALLKLVNSRKQTSRYWASTITLVKKRPIESLNNLEKYPLIYR